MQEMQETHGFDPWVSKIPWRGKCTPLQYSCLENFCGQRSLANYSLWGMGLQKVRHD